jgi:hypothetical protein
MNSQYVKRLLTPRNIGHEKIRIGPKHDGGYVISKTCLDQTSAVYSLGIGDEVGFDIDIADRGLTVYQYDGTISGTPHPHNNFKFKSLMMSSQTLAEELTANGHIDRKDLMLKMDIEGAEYELLYHLDWQLLDCFNQIVLELHHVTNFAMSGTMLQKFCTQFIPIHVHANNNDYRSVDGVPNMLELTFVNTNMLVTADSCPMPGLDYRNFDNFHEFYLDWWK